MATSLRIKLTSAAASTLTFDVDGEWRWDQPERIYREAEEPPVLEQIRDNWTFVGGAILTPDGSTEGGWDAFQAALAALDSATDQIAKVEILRVEAGVESVEATLGPPTHEGFKVDRLSCDGPFAPAPRATHVIAFPIEMRFSARRVFERDVTLVDGTTTVADVVSFEQTIAHEADESGLGTITADTLITTKAGTDARIKGRLLGLLPLPGSSWSYDTNSTDGVDLTTIDADEVTSTSRVPRRVRVFSRVRQWGIDVGVSTPGTKPGGFSYEDARQDDGIEITRVVTAEATGPGAEAWVRSKAPAGQQVEETTSRPTGRTFRAAWTVRTSKTGQAFTVVDGVLGGGGEDFDYEEVAGGYLPAKFTGAEMLWTLEIKVSIERRGGSGSKTELPLPPLLRDGWELNRKLSREGFPKQEEQTATASAARWVRQAALLYWSPTAPTNDPIEWLRDNAGKSVPSYSLKK